VRCDRELGRRSIAILCRPCVAELLADGLSDSVLESVYRAASASESRLTNADIPWTLSEVFPRWLEANIPRKAFIAEFGAGGGYHAQALVDRGFANVLVTDLDPAAIESCRARFPHLRAEVMDANALALEAESIDVAISIEVIEHLLEPERHIAEVSRVLRRGGHFLVRTPNALIANAYYRWIGRYDMAIWHPSTFRFDPLVQLLEETGFSTEDLPMETLPESQIQKIPRALRFLSRVPLRGIPPAWRPSIVLVATKG